MKSNRKRSSAGTLSRRITQAKLMFEVEKQFPLMLAGDAASACRWMLKERPRQAHSASDLAVITVKAWARHQLTDYDTLRHRLHEEGVSSTEAKSQAHDQVRALVNSIVDA